MLFLNRKPNEVIYIQDSETGETLTLLVTKVHGKTVTLGFENDSKKFTILRKEVKERQDGKDFPNPFYKDRIPKFWLDKQNQKDSETHKAIDAFAANLETHPIVEPASQD